MVAIPFDTLKFAEKLESGGFTAQQARTAAEAFADATSQELAAKGDLREMELRLDAKLANIDAKLERLEIRITVRLGAMLAAAVAIIAALMKLH